MTCRHSFWWFFLAVCVLVMPSQAFAVIAVGDGTLSDWGISPGSYGNVSQWTPGSGISAKVEDDNPGINYLNPGYGGQYYDVEAIYFKREGQTAFFAVVSGYPLANYGGWAPGDLAFDFGSNGSYEFGLETLGNLAGSVQGELFGNTTSYWSKPYYAVSSPFALTGGSSLGTVPFSYNDTTYAANRHFFFEVGIPISEFGSYWTNYNPDFTVHWTMGCGNDALDLRVSAVTTPEPNSMILVLAALGGFFFYKKRYSFPKNN